MWDFLVMGGLPFTLPLTALAVVVVLLAGRKAVDLFINMDQPPAALKRGLNTIVHLGGFSFALGVFAQAIGLYQALNAIEAAGDVSPALVMGGLKVSMITTVYGLGIFIVAAILWFGLHWRYEQLIVEG